MCLEENIDIRCYLGVMAVNTSELATIFKTNLKQVASNKNHIITFVLCMPYCLLMVKLKKMYLTLVLK